MISSLLALSIAVVSCSDNEQIESGKINACKLKQAKELLEEHPDNTLFKHDVEELERFVEINRKLSGDVDAFDKAVKEHLQDCE